MFDDLQQHWPPASRPKPIVIFGAGSIVTDAHLPAYANAGYRVAGLYDPDLDKARALAKTHGFTAYDTPEAAAAAGDVVFDLATPPDAIAGILRMLP